MYGETFNSHQKLDPKDDIRNRLLTLRRSNIVLGNSIGGMTTTATDGYNNKHHDSRTMNAYAGKAKASLTNLNINDGDGDFKSMAQADYVKKKPEIRDINQIKKTVRDLKCIFFKFKLMGIAQHFTFGFDYPDYGTEAGSHFSDGKLGLKAKNLVDTKILQKNSYDIGADGFPAKKVFKTIYEESLAGIDRSKAVKVPPFVASSEKNRSDILFGTKDGSKNSEQQGQ
jgi:hypothetical protein